MVKLRTSGQFSDAILYHHSNKRQSEVVPRKNMKIFNVLKTILD